MRKRVLTGITPSGKPHLGNILGAIIPAIEFSQKDDVEAFYFISDLHSLISIPDGKTRVEYTSAIAATWLAFGLDINRTFFYRQSRVPAVTELTWYLNCLTPFPLLENAHAFKSKSENVSEVSSGLFTYPVLMTADILLYDANVIPVGKDQKQHIEMARDIAKKFNNAYGNVFSIPDAYIKEEVQTIIGIDGRKMSKSYNNYIDIFLPDKALRKQIMSIQTDSLSVSEIKNPDSCNVFNIYRHVAEADQVLKMRENYLKGGYGYGEAKEELFEIIKQRFSVEREKFIYYMQNSSIIEDCLLIGESKVEKIASDKILMVRKILGFG